MHNDREFTMAWYGYLLIALAAIGFCYWLYYRRHHVKAWGQAVQIARARELFGLQRARLEDLFLKAAASTGKPRGLRWVKCAFELELVLARERQTNQLLGLVPVTISFEAVEGGDMEGVAAVGNLRNATAVFSFSAGQWQTAGKAVFNLNPPEVLQHFQKEYEPVENEAGRTKQVSSNGQPMR